MVWACYTLRLLGWGCCIVIAWPGNDDIYIYILCQEIIYQVLCCVVLPSVTIPVSLAGRRSKTLGNTPALSLDSGRLRM